MLCPRDRSTMQSDHSLSDSVVCTCRCGRRHLRCFSSSLCSCSRDAGMDYSRAAARQRSSARLQGSPAMSPLCLVRQSGELRAMRFVEVGKSVCVNHRQCTRAPPLRSRCHGRYHDTAGRQQSCCKACRDKPGQLDILQLRVQRRPHKDWLRHFLQECASK